MNYLDKYKGQYGRNSLYDILSLDPNTPADWSKINNNYNAVGIDKVIIDGDTFTNYGDFQFVWEKSYVKSPTRSNSGAIENLNSYATFVTPHLIINFSVMSIDDYRAIMRKDLSKNEFVVECYDPIYNQKFVGKMYFGTPAMAKLRTIARCRFNNTQWEEFVEIVGVEGYSVELIGTNSELDLVSVTYHSNPPVSGYTDETVGEPSVYKGQEIVMGAAATGIKSLTFDGRYRFSTWNINPEGGNQGNFPDNSATTINDNLVLYAQWESSTENILSFNYGVADPAINGETNTYEMNRKVTKGKAIGTLPAVETPKVTYNEKQYTPYYNGKWYRTPIKVSNSANVTSSTVYWTDRDSAIYLIYDVYSYSLNLYLDGSLYQNTSIKYGESVNLPQLVKSGYTFDGWYTTSNFQSGTKFSGTMPPYGLNLYARWIKE